MTAVMFLEIFELAPNDLEEGAVLLKENEGYDLLIEASRDQGGGVEYSASLYLKDGEREAKLAARRLVFNGEVCWFVSRGEASEDLGGGSEPPARFLTVCREIANLYKAG